MWTQVRLFLRLAVRPERHESHFGFHSIQYFLMAIRFLYPCYFDASLTRAGGRRVAKSLAVSAPNMAMISRAAKVCGIPVLAEERDAHHPAQWHKSGGRIQVEYAGSKEALLTKVAQKLGGK